MLFVLISFFIYNLSLCFFVINEEFLLLLLVLFVANMLFFLSHDKGNNSIMYQLIDKSKYFFTKTLFVLKKTI